MPDEMQEFKVGDTTYKFPKSYSDEKVQSILTSQGVIKGKNGGNSNGGSGSGSGSGSGKAVDSTKNSEGFWQSAWDQLNPVTGLASKGRSMLEGAQEITEGHVGSGLTHFLPEALTSGVSEAQTLLEQGTKTGQQAGEGNKAGAAGTVVGATLPFALGAFGGREYGGFGDAEGGISNTLRAAADSVPDNMVSKFLAMNPKTALPMKIINFFKSKKSGLSETRSMAYELFEKQNGRKPVTVEQRIIAMHDLEEFKKALKDTTAKAAKEKITKPPKPPKPDPPLWAKDRPQPQPEPYRPAETFGRPLWNRDRPQPNAEEGGGAQEPAVKPTPAGGGKGSKSDTGGDTGGSGGNGSSGDGVPVGDAKLPHDTGQRVNTRVNNKADAIKSFIDSHPDIIQKGAVADDATLKRLIQDDVLKHGKEKGILPQVQKKLDDSILNRHGVRHPNPKSAHDLDQWSKLPSSTYKELVNSGYLREPTTAEKITAGKTEAPSSSSLMGENPFKPAPPTKATAALVSKLNEIEPSKSPVPTVRLRPLLGMSKEAFDDAMVQASKEGKVQLWEDADPMNKSEADRSLAVYDKRTGRYYSGVSVK